MASLDRDSICKVPDCEKTVGKTGHLGMCPSHYQKFHRKGTTDPSPSRLNTGITNPGDAKGYVNVSGYICLEWRQDGKPRRMLQHRYVMEQHLGRPLLPNENVHHVNGDRADNRIENLELWSKSQPPGQRVEDKLRWAHELIDLYERAVGPRAVCLDDLKDKEKVA